MRLQPCYPEQGPQRQDPLGFSMKQHSIISTKLSFTTKNYYEVTQNIGSNQFQELNNRQYKTLILERRETPKC